VISQLEVVSLGHTAEGIETFMDKLAYDSDGVMLIGRVKWHTDFDGRIESGLFKMLAIGLGKFAGAQRYHNFAYRIGLENVILSIGRQVLKSGKVKGLRFATLEAICRYLDCQPGDLIEYVPDEAHEAFRQAS